MWEIQKAFSVNIYCSLIAYKKIIQKNGLSNAWKSQKSPIKPLTLVNWTAGNLAKSLLAERWGFLWRYSFRISLASDSARNFNSFLICLCWFSWSTNLFWMLVCLVLPSGMSPSFTIDIIISCFTSLNCFSKSLMRLSGGLGTWMGSKLLSTFMYSVAWSFMRSARSSAKAFWSRDSSWAIYGEDAVMSGKIILKSIGWKNKQSILRYFERNYMQSALRKTKCEMNHGPFSLNQPWDSKNDLHF